MTFERVHIHPEYPAPGHASSPAAVRPIVDGSRAPDPNRGVLVALPASAGTVDGERVLKLDEGNWLIRAVRVDAAGLAVASTAVTGAFALVLLQGVGGAMHTDAEIIPLRGKAFVRAFDSCQVTLRGVVPGSATLWALEARKVTGPVQEVQCGPGNALAAGAHTIIPPVFATHGQFIGTPGGGDTIQFRDAAAANIGPALAIPPDGVVDLAIPIFAFDVVFTTGGRGVVDFWRLA